VTIENFLAWKAKFDAEMEELQKKTKLQNEVDKRLTGENNNNIGLVDRSR